MMDIDGRLLCARKRLLLRAQERDRQGQMLGLNTSRRVAQETEKRSYLCKHVEELPQGLTSVANTLARDA